MSKGREKVVYRQHKCDGLKTEMTDEMRVLSGVVLYMMNRSGPRTEP